MTFQIEPFGDDAQKRRIELLNERAGIIERADVFDTRWWRIACICRGVSNALVFCACALFLMWRIADWSFWFAWGALITSQAFGCLHSWGARATIKRKLIAVEEMKDINDRIVAEIRREESH